MKLRSRPVLVALIYIVTSIFVGPAIYLTGYGLLQNSDHCGGGNRLVVPDRVIGDTTEATPLSPTSEEIERRNVTTSGHRLDTVTRGVDFIAVQAFRVAAPGIMLASGIFLMTCLLTNRSRIGRSRLILSSVGVLFMMFGYGLTLATGLTNTSCT
ncbi:hypothetical protein [Nocardia pneumoniae]|uniref:hypothetical protein n=1 Tax=Nocardia pneumoniae TaxID=228601 RepID=UPI0003005F5B|nr:hypothetical protein [Nocardia pneumoniae]